MTSDVKLTALPYSNPYPLRENGLLMGQQVRIIRSYLFLNKNVEEAMEMFKKKYFSGQTPNKEFVECAFDESETHFTFSHNREKWIDWLSQPFEFERTYYGELTSYKARLAPLCDKNGKAVFQGFEEGFIAFDTADAYNSIDSMPVIFIQEGSDTIAYCPVEVIATISFEKSNNARFNKRDAQVCAEFPYLERLLQLVVHSVAENTVAQNFAFEKPIYHFLNGFGFLD